MARDGKYPADMISGSGAAPGDTLVWDGTRWVPGAAAPPVVVDPTEPASPATGQLWYDTDATC
jgi:hypothetical protein